VPLTRRSFSLGSRSDGDGRSNCSRRGWGEGDPDFKRLYASLSDASERDARKASENESAAPRIDRSRGFSPRGNKAFRLCGLRCRVGLYSACTRRLKSIFSQGRAATEREEQCITRGTRALTARDLIHSALRATLFPASSRSPSSAHVSARCSKHAAYRAGERPVRAHNYPVD